MRFLFKLTSVIVILSIYRCKPNLPSHINGKDTSKPMESTSTIKEFTKLNKIHSDSFYIVSEIKDGDTFSVFYPDNSNTETIRPIGIDAPEAHKTPKEDIQCFGKEATDYLSNLIMGKKVRIQLDKDQYDPYKRTLAYVYIEDGTFVNAEIVKNGFADTMNFKPNLKYKELFLNLRNEAKDNKRGMWGVCY